VKVSPRLVVYVSPWCSNCADTQAALTAWKVPATLINIKQDKEAAQHVRAWTGFVSVPTLVIAEQDSVEPCEPPAPLQRGASPRGIDRGTLLTEPDRTQLRAWLIKHGLLQAEGMAKA
jgi:glutaredoxin